MSGSVRQIAGGVGGAIIGGFFGMPWLGFAVGSALFAPGIDGPDAPDPGNLSFNTSAYGKFMYWGYGTYRVTPVTFWTTDFVAHHHSEEVGGKGGGGGATREWNTYTRSFAVYLRDCSDGKQVTGVRRIWNKLTGELLYVAGEDATAEEVVVSERLFAQIRVYPGSLTQDPDPLIEAHEGWTPAHRGHAYAVFEHFDHGESKQALPLEIEITTADPMVPALVSEVVYQGVIVYYGDGFFQTAEAMPGSFTGTDPGAQYIGLCVFRNYAYDGSLLSERALTQSIRKSDGNTSLVYHKTCAIRGEPDSFFVVVVDEYRIRLYPNQAELQFKTGEIHTVELNKPYTFAGGYYWFPSANNALRIDKSMRYTAYTVPDAQHQSVLVREDPITRRLFLRYQTLDTGESKLAEIDPRYIGTEDFFLWEHTFGFGSNYGTSTNNLFEAYGGRLVNIDTQSGAYPTGSISVYQVNAASLTLIGTAQNLSGGRNASAPGPGLFFHGSRLYRLNDATTIEGEPLAEVCADLCLRAGLALDQIDTSALPEAYVRQTITSQRAARDWLAELGQIYGFRLRDSAGVLEFVPKGQAPVATLALEELGLQEPPPALPPPPLSTQRSQGSDLPRAVTVSYVSADADYAPGAQPYRMHDYPQGREVMVHTSHILSDQAAFDYAYVACKEPHLERLSWDTSVGLRRLALEPGDVLTLPTGDAWIREIQQRGGTVLELTLQAEASSAHVPSGLPAPTQSSPPVSMKMAGPTRLEILDAPAILDTHTGPGYLVAACGYLSGWEGCALYISRDGGESYSPLLALNTAATIGTALNALGDGLPGSLDRENSVTVSLSHGSLNSVSLPNLYAGQNAAMLGRELIKFAVAEYLGNRQYRLSILQRGRKGTEWASGDHEAGEPFVLLTTALQRIPLSIDDLGKTRLIKAVSYGNDLSDAEPVAFTPEGASLKPWPPATPRAWREGTDWRLTCLERTRFGGELRALVGITRDPEWDGWDLEILDEAGIVMRNILGLTEPSYTWTGGEQAADFGALQCAVRYRWYQRSTVIGRGYPAEGVVSDNGCVLPTGPNTTLRTVFHDGTQFLVDAVVTGIGIDTHTIYYSSTDGELFTPIGEMDGANQFTTLEPGIAKGDGMYLSFTKQYAQTLPINWEVWWFAKIASFAGFPTSTPTSQQPIPWASSSELPLVVAWDAANARFAVLTSAKKLRTTTDMETWTLVGDLTLPVTSPTWNWYPGMWLELFQDDTYWYCLHSGRGSQYDAAYTGLLRSTDLQTWAWTNFDGGEDWDLLRFYGVAHRGSTVLLIGFGRFTGEGTDLDTVILRATDGNNFSLVYKEPRTQGTGNPDFLEMQAVGSNGFVASGVAGVLSSEDGGLTWHYQNMQPPPTELRSNGSVVVGRRKTRLLSNGGITDEPWYTNNGSTWIRSLIED